MTQNTTIYLATGNAHKVEEIAAMLAASGLPVKVESAKALGGMPEVDENGKTFAANARLKAEALASKLPEGTWALADDSGLCVNILSGAPGILSARYAGIGSTDDDNNRRLMDELAMVPATRRAAKFVCCFVLLDRQGREHIFTGVCPGRIIQTRRGLGGFGYDPLFVPEGYEETFAQLGEEVKNSISHRARAVQALIEWLKSNA
ncbi:MAG: RdgB/HAM1 family non-canonical purine NTP pyrophosphatase [Puniceicoccales bacterium]